MPNYPLPSDTSAVYKRIGRCSNPGLMFDKYAPFTTGAPSKQQALAKVKECKPDAMSLNAFRTRWRAMVDAANAILFEAKTDWRFITGLGRKGPLEIGFTFHNIYGFPIIPGSGLKGLARSWAYFAIRESHPDTDPEEHPDFIAVFGHDPGDEETVGGAVFFDAIPLDSPDLDLDVMTPHFSDYYQGENEPPSDNQGPVPIPFLTVKPGVRFAFAVGWRGDPNPQAHALAVKWLQQGLKELGAGAKTSAGYGYFVLSKEPPPARPMEKADAAEPSQPELEPEPPLAWRQGTVRHYRPDKGYGRLVDDETDDELSFRREAIEEKGWSPGKKHKVRYAVVEREGRLVVVKIRKA